MRRCLLKTIILCVADLLQGVLLLCFMGAKFSLGNLAGHLASGYSFSTSPLDLFLLLVARTIFAAFGFSLLLSNAVQCSRWYPTLAKVSFSFCILSCCFSATKLLALSDQGKMPFDRNWSIYTLLATNFVFSILSHLLWSAFIKVNKRLQASTYEALNEETSGDESEEEDSEAEAVDGKQTFEIIFRLLQYCKDEWCVVV